MINILQQIKEAGVPAWMWLVMVIVVAVLFVLLYYYKFMCRLVERRETAESRQRRERLHLMLMANHVNIWTYDVNKQLLTCNMADSNKQQVMTREEFAACYGAEVLEQMRGIVQRIIAGEKEEETTELTLTRAGETRDFRLVFKPLHRDANGKPIAIIITRIDLTDQRRRQRQAKQMLLQYQSIFNNAMADMMYFDADGRLVEINQKACETFHIDPKVISSGQVMTFHDLFGLDEQHLEKRDFFYATLNIGEMYYELQLMAIHDEQGKTMGIYATGRNVTEQVEAYQKQQKAINTLAAATVETERYISNINYVLNVGGVRLANYAPDTHTLTLYKSIGQVQLRLTPARYMTLVSKKAMQNVLYVLHSMDRKTKANFELELETTLRIGGQPLVLQFNFIPTYDEQGQLVDYFGMCRDVSEIKTTEAELERKTQKAHQIEAEKNAFLRNMSFEIRTPLNTVVGFAELFEKPHDSDDELVYINQIKDNSEHLLSLINDILFLSRLDARMIEFNPQFTDFSKIFENHCQASWKDYRKEGVHYVVENDFKQLVVKIDAINVGHIINQVVQNAAVYTKSGIVRAHYDYVGGKLIIVIDDTGNGIDRQTLSTIYDRFNTNSKGTGLGLPICKELLTQMGGRIEISSTPGQGTTVWIALPCEATVIERKEDMEA